MHTPLPSVTLIVGPTASGKSALAMDLARRTQGWIVNADAVQVYTELRLLTARPSLADEAEIPHHLYGYVTGQTHYHVARWIEDVTAILQHAKKTHTPLIIVGGTGLYIKALIEGLSPIPPLTDAVRLEGLHLLETHGVQKLYDQLKNADSEDMTRLIPQDSQRVLRAWSIWRQTGKSLAHFQRLRDPSPLQPQQTTRYFLNPPREELKERAALRLRHMFDQGALEEVRALQIEEYHPLSTLHKALGVKALQAYLKEEISWDEAYNRTLLDTFHYIKRQVTFFRHQLPDFTLLDSPAALK